MANKKFKNFFEELKTGVVENVKNYQRPFFEPTGAMEPVIIAVGTTTKLHTLINCQCNNKGGKTAIGAQIICNIIFEPEKTYFNYPNYIDWPFKDEFGIIKNGRIVGSSKNVKDNGPIRQEIVKWWPKGRYKAYKNNQPYYSLYVCENGWLVDVMTFNQSPMDFEGPVKSFHWIDEPSKPELMGAFTSRQYKGGIYLFTHTPKGAGAMLDCISDLKDRGTHVIKINSELWDNSSETGKLNSTGTKRGLMTNKEIEEYIKTIPPDEYEARVKGKGSEKEGKIYKKFNRNVHVRDFDIDDPRFKSANCYLGMDYHVKCYPFLTWWAVFPPNSAGRCYNVCYNEWPRFETFSLYYDEIRIDSQFNMTLQDLKKLIELLDYTNYGYNIVRRGIDPNFENCREIAAEFAKLGMEFIIPKKERVEVKRNDLIKLMEFDNRFGIENLDLHTEPSLFIMPHCRNTIRSFERHYWEDKESIKRNKNTEVESTRYRDPSDSARIFRSLIGNSEFTPIIQKHVKNKKIIKEVKTIEDEYLSSMKNICLYK